MKGKDNPTIGDITIKRRYWGCFTCRSLKNSNKLVLCQYCGTKRAQDRYVIKRDKILYICKIFTEKIFPIVSICKILENKQELYGKVRLKMTGDTLLECMDAAIEDFNSDNLLTFRSMKSFDEYGIEHSDSVSEEMSTLSSTVSVPKAKEDPSLDLFHRVMKNGENYAYDGNIGQYVHVDTLKDRNDGNIIRDLQYLKFMKREKHEMTKIVEETIQRRSDEYIENVIDITHDNLKEWKGKIPCSLCEYHFPPSQLLGTISLNTLLKWRSDHHLPIDQYPSGKSSLMKKYEMMKLCVFCTQFFDSNFSHSLDVEMEANAEFKQQQKEKLIQKKSKPRETPISKLQVDISIAELYNKKVGSLRQKVLEPLTTRELKRLEEENRHLQYLKAKKKFRDYKKKFDDDLEVWKNLQSPNSEIQNEPENHLYAPEPQSHPEIRSSNSAGQIPISSSKHQRPNERSQSANSLPRIPKLNQPVEKLPTVKEARKEKPKENPIKKRKVKTVQESQSFLTALDDVLAPGGDGDEASVAEDHEPEVAEKMKKERPEWSTDCDREPPKRKNISLSENKQILKKKEKIAKLVRSAQDCYSQKVEADVPKKIKSHQKIDTSFTKRRRNRLDPRNNIKKPKKGNKKRRVKKRVSPKEAEEVLKAIEETTVQMENIELAPQRAVEIFEKHQRPNLTVVKKLQIGRRPAKVETEKIDTLTAAEIEDESLETTKDSEKVNLKDDLDGNYDDDAFETDGEATILSSVPKTFSDGDDEDYKDDDEFEEDHEQSPVRIALNSSAKFTLPTSILDEDPSIYGDSNPSNSRPSTRREKGGGRGGESSGVSGIELLSSGTQRIGSASNSRRSSRKLPPFENTEPLILSSDTSDTQGRPPSRNISSSSASSRDKKSVKDLPSPAPSSQLPTISPFTNSPLPTLKTPQKSKFPSNYNYVGDTRRTSAPQLHSISSTSNSSDTTTITSGITKEVNVDSKAHQQYMSSHRSSVMRLTTNTNLTPEMVGAGSPTQLDMNIMKQGGHVRRAVKREDSFDKLTRKIAKSLANRQLSL